MDKSNHILDSDQVKRIRRALLVGLASYGEIERLSNGQEIQKACGIETPEELRVIHPTGAADTVSDFATALCFLDQLESEPEASAAG